MVSNSGAAAAFLRSGALGPQGVDASRDRIPSFARVSLTARDRDILSLACRKLDGKTLDFAEALRALREAVEERIPAGRIYYLPSSMGAPVVGSILSGVGIAAGADGVLVVRVAAGGGRTILGRFAL